MSHEFTVLDDGHTRIEVDFHDEGVELVGATTIKGGEVEAERYLPTFERDLRRNFSELFPPPPEPEHEEGEGME